jgi:hypothetical protein
MSRRSKSALGPLLVAAALLAAPAGAGAQIPGLPTQPILGPNLSPVDGSSGGQATPAPVGGVTPPPRNPFMAPNGRSNIHDDAYMTDTYSIGGPLGHNVQVSSAFFLRECGSIAFDSAGRLVTVCVGVDRPVLAMLDPQTLNVLAAMPLPLRNLGGSLNIFSDFSGGGYFYLDNENRAVLPTTDHHVLVVSETAPPAAPAFAVDRDYDHSSAVPQGDAIESVLPDWNGRLWFISRNGLVGTIDRGSGAVSSLSLGEGISNSFSVDDSGGVFVVSDRALYRFDAGPQGEPTVSWREVYPNSGVHKPGQSDAGSGTTPTLMGTRWVAITDNADPLDVVVYRRARASSAGREVCRQPVFAAGGGDTDQSLIGTDDAMVVENNYGYSGPAATELGGTTSPGLARVDLTFAHTKAKKKAKHRKRHRKPHRARSAKKHRKHSKKKKKPAKQQVSGCRLVWTSNERAPSVVPKLSLTNGLVYTYTKPPRTDGADPWYFTALDFRSGATVYKRLSGVGLGFNNNYAPVTLGPDGAAYVGVLGGVTRFSDGP